MLAIDGAVYDPKLIVFDKDGTLLDFHYLWGAWSVAFLRAVTSVLEDGERYWTVLGRTLGYDADARRILHDSPLAIEPTDGLVKVVATVLYQRGIPWNQATEAAWHGARAAEDNLNLADLVRPVGDVAGLLRRVRATGVLIGIATTDQRNTTLSIMELLGVTDLVDHLVCGDDGVAIKPAPDMILSICAALGIRTVEAIVIGDTTADMIMGDRAGVLLRVGVLTGVGSREDLRCQADVVLDSIQDIEVI